MQFDRDRFLERIIASRGELVASAAAVPRRKAAEEGGCGVVGFAASVPVRGRHIFEPSIQMHNRGNGKGGGIAAAGLIPAQFGVDAAALRDDYILQVAFLDPEAVAAVEKECIEPVLRVDHRARLEPACSYEDLGLETRPPDIVRYFVRVRPDALGQFAERHGLAGAPERAVEDEFIYRNSVRLNERFYASLGEKRAFVLSHARNLIIFKIVGYAEQVVQYYGLQDMEARVWIAHQRYPTKGRVWHPAGAHPFIGLNDALVHNGDFANYYSVSEYLRQHNIVPQFLTDTEVSVLLFDLWSRTYGYPLEYVIEALAPTTELDFDQLPDEKKKAYRAIQALHMHGSPDGPWFFIIARSDPENDRFQLLGITDTSMLRPQVFSIQEGEVSIGLVASEKQAIDATLHSLAREDSRFRLEADRYWNARGGSHTDGGAFVFTVQGTNGASTLTCTDKFGKVIQSPPGQWRIDWTSKPAEPDEARSFVGKIRSASGPEELFRGISRSFPSWKAENFRWLIDEVRETAGRGEEGLAFALEFLTLMVDRRYDCGAVRPSVVRQMACRAIDGLLDGVAAVTDEGPGRFKRIDWQTREALRPPMGGEAALVVFAPGFPPEGDACDARLLVKAYEAGWRRFVVYGLRGQRFHGCGLGPETQGVRLDLYGSSGDYVGSGIDGMEIRVHGNGQDQLGQIMKRGRLVIFGDVGQTFLYGAKGGEVYVMGNAAGRPLINAVGRPRVVINGTCLDFLAESFMAGNPLNGGGFAVLNGMAFNDQGRPVEQPSPYPGSNLFSLASGGAIYVRDPHRKVSRDQLNNGMIVELARADWTLILPYLRENERLFGISIEEDLLKVGSEIWPPEKVYRKVQPAGKEIDTGLEE
jgi:glutamate synthase domain-containing protein 1/glutamate synthase domain-containing protein 3